MESFTGTREKKEQRTMEELLELVMYGNRATGEKDQAYEELKGLIKKQKQAVKDLRNSAEQFRKDSQEFMLAWYDKLGG